MLILNTLAPVFLLIAVGAALQVAKLVSPGFLREANRVTYLLGLPALVFSQLSHSFHEAGGAGVMLLVVWLATMAIIVAGYGVALLLRTPGSALGTFVQGGFRGNLAFVGLPVVFSLPDTPLASGVSVRAAAVLVVAPMMVFYNIAGVIVLLLSQHRLGWAMVKPVARQLATTPPLVATVAGIAWALAGWSMPAAIDKALSALGEMALPLGLLGVGGSLATIRPGVAWRPALGSALVKTALAPLLGWVLGGALGLGATELKVVLILMACPTAVVSYTLAVEMRGDGELAASTISLSVFTSLLALGWIVGAF